MPWPFALLLQSWSKISSLEASFLSSFSLWNNEGLKKKNWNLFWTLSYQKASVPLKHPRSFLMGVCYPSSLVPALGAPVVVQDLCLLSVVQR